MLFNTSFFTLVLRALHKPCNIIAYCIASSYSVNLCCDTSTFGCIRHTGNTYDTINLNYVNSSLMGHVAFPPTGLEPFLCGYVLPHVMRCLTRVPAKGANSFENEKWAVASGTSSACHFGSRSWEQDREEETLLFEIQVEGDMKVWDCVSWIILLLGFVLSRRTQRNKQTKKQWCPQKLLYFPAGISRMFLKEAFTSAGH